ncbi:MAG: flagellar basal body P-ring protein FlgI [Kiritimatiellae bacterium]|nr:flagellar basal body P-ring protein FlgI [Kiritimatiellia bacterium]
MKKLTVILSALLILSLACAHGALEVRIKDIARVAGLEPVELIGYGIVTGLKGTGDKDLKLTRQTLANFLENFNLSLPIGDIKSKNVAAVIVTATVPRFHSEGDRLDVTVSSVGDAISLQGGYLLMAPMLNAGGQLYALAQGNVTVGGYEFGAGGAGGATETKNVPTTGIVPGGGTLKYGQAGTFYENGILRLILNHPDFTTAARVADAINENTDSTAIARDASTVVVQIPQPQIDSGQAAVFVAGLEKLPVRPDVPARVIVNERTGTIVMGSEVRIGPAVVAHGNLVVKIKGKPIISQPPPFSPQGQTVEANDLTVDAVESRAKITAIGETASVQDLASTLTALGATPTDLISILEALARAGALQMKIETM